MYRLVYTLLLCTYLVYSFVQRTMLDRLNVSQSRGNFFGSNIHSGSSFGVSWLGPEVAENILSLRYVHNYHVVELTYNFELIFVMALLNFDLDTAGWVYMTVFIKKIFELKQYIE